MKITNNGINNAMPTPIADATTPDPVTSERPASEAALKPDGYQPSSEYVRILGMVQQQPEVRLDRVQEVMERLRQGVYGSAASVEQTAEAMLHSQD
jgi:hypothetical protein